MDNALFHIRIKCWHFYWGKGKYFPLISYHDWSYNSENKTPFFEVYNFFGLF